MEQQTAEWHIFRSNGIGSSDAAVIMDIDPYRDRNDLLLDKLGKGKPFKRNPAMELGVKFEPVARSLSYFDLGIEFTPHTLTHPEHDWMRASLDGYNIYTNSLCEIKYMGEKNFIKCRDDVSALPHHYPQVQHQIAVTGFSEAWYIPYYLTENKQEIAEIAYIKIARSDEYIDRLITLEKEFWDEVVGKRGAQSLL